MESRKAVKTNRATQAPTPFWWKTVKIDSGIKIRPMATGTMKAGPRMPTVVGMRQTKKAAGQPKPCLRPSVYAERDVIIRTTPGKYRKIVIHDNPLTC